MCIESKHLFKRKLIYLINDFFYILQNEVKINWNQKLQMWLRQPRQKKPKNGWSWNLQKQH